MDRYNLLSNDQGDLLLQINEQPAAYHHRLLYDGSDVALLCGTGGMGCLIKNLSEKARAALKAVTEIAVSEINSRGDVVREYIAPIRFVQDVRSFINK